MTLKDFITEEEYQVLRQYWENEIEMAEETGEATEHLEARLEPWTKCGARQNNPARLTITS